MERVWMQLDFGLKQEAIIKGIELIKQLVIKNINTEC